MIEDSVEAFVARWRAHATDATAFGRAEGSPLLELAIGDVVFQGFERTGPYLAAAGHVRVVIHAMTAELEPIPPAHRRFEAVGVARLDLAGPVVARDEALAVVDAGVPVIVGVDAPEAPEPPPVGTWVACEGLAPVQVFVLPPARGARLERASTDELV